MAASLISTSAQLCGLYFQKAVVFNDLKTSLAGTTAWPDDSCSRAAEEGKGHVTHGAALSDSVVKTQREEP